MSTLVSTSAGRAARSTEPPPEALSPPGQVNVVTVNARQQEVLNLPSFTRMYNLAQAFRFRPEAFNGGVAGGIIAPDVIIFQEMRDSNLEIIKRLFNQKSNFHYEMVAPAQSSAKMLINTDSVTLAGEPLLWPDSCLNRDFPEERGRWFQVARFLEKPTGAPFAVAGVHLYTDYSITGQENCTERNIQDLRSKVEAEPSPVIVGGDFNRRPVATPFECDPEESSEPLRWYLMMTQPTVGRPYLDAVRASKVTAHGTMGHEWTHESIKPKVRCDGVVDERRTRIDYLFSSGAVVATAHADHPGWAGPDPGSKNKKYSDHRFVWGRFVISGPPRPSAPTATAVAGGDIHISWQPVDGAQGYVVYRARGWQSYNLLTTLPAEATAYADSATQHETRYRYAIAPIGLNGGHGLESRGAVAIADERGPRIKRALPAPDSYRVDRDAIVQVVFNERVKRASVTAETIRLFRNWNSPVAGVVTRQSGRVLTFTPYRTLAKKEIYRVVVDSVSDVVGNFGPRVIWRFRTT